MLHARKDYNRIQDPENKIPKDEPVFLLRGQDALAAVTLRNYADRVENFKQKGWRKIVVATREQADRMDDWHKNKFPDMP